MNNKNIINPIEKKSNDKTKSMEPTTTTMIYTKEQEESRTILIPLGNPFPRCLVVMVVVVGGGIPSRLTRPLLLLLRRRLLLPPIFGPIFETP